MMNKFRYAIICFTAVILWTGCSKSNDGPNVELSDGTSTVITDLAGDVDASVGSSAPGKEKRDFHTFLFRFSDQKQTWLKQQPIQLNILKEQIGILLSPAYTTVRCM